MIVKKKKRMVPLFASAITPGGGTSPVVGTAALKPGSYDFFCSLHPGMTGTLTVQ
jgi:plastocyanin